MTCVSVVGCEDHPTHPPPPPPPPPPSPYLEGGRPGCHELCLFSAPAEEGSPTAGPQSPLHMPLFVLCLVLAALLLLAVTAFTAALLRVRKMSGKEPPRGHGRLWPWRGGG